MPINKTLSVKTKSFLMGKNYMENWIPIVISIISLVVSFIGIGFNIYKDKRDNAELSVTWDNELHRH